MRIFVLTHEHQYGTSIYPFKVSNNELFPLDAEDVATRLGVDFEPEKNEFVNVDSFDESEIVELPAELD